MKKLKFFYTEWCSFCKKMKPSIDNLISDGYNIEMIDADDEYTVADEYKIDKIPTFVLEDKGMEINRWVGLLESKEIKKILYK